MDQEGTADHLSRALRQLFVGAMDGVPRLEGDDPGRAHALECPPHLGRVMPKIDKAIVLRQAQDHERAAQVPSAPQGHLGDHRVLHVDRPEHRPGFGLEIPPVPLLDRQNGE
jgi:hypothetical protein